ncbi:NADH-quinone oxidoreductase subunit C [Deferribacter thermophilus]|uniref:NADH-quinone oxidoreductase subunit C n=1 Tax=Deferribacter thermophilus TaxID=53573 RepID=UPI003C1672D6
MVFDDIVKYFSEKYPGKVSGKVEFKCNFLTVDKSIFKDVLRELKEKFSFKYIVDIVATHWPNRDMKFDVVYNIYSIENNIRVFVKVMIPDEKIETVTDIWKGANFMEREQYDLVGVVFEGHPDLRRILLPDFFEGHPLRKDFPLKERKWFNKFDEQNLGIRFTK